MLVEKRGIYVQIARINPLGDGLIVVEASQEELDDLHLEVEAAARMGTEKEAVILGG
jgi:hypothetical protein